jgi:hypothetical protein
MVKITEGMALVRQECANLVAGVCIGMTTRGTLFREAGNCYLLEDKTCEYYDIAVFPLTKHQVKKARRRR